MKAGFGFGSGGSGGGADADAFATGTPTTLTGGATTNITVGDNADHKSVQVNYQATRGVLEEGGVINIAVTNTGVTWDGGMAYGDAIGIAFAVSVVGTNITLACTLNAGVNATFYFTMIRTLAV